MQNWYEGRISSSSSRRARFRITGNLTQLLTGCFPNCFFCFRAFFLSCCFFFFPVKTRVYSILCFFKSILSYLCDPPYYYVPVDWYLSKILLSLTLIGENQGGLCGLLKFTPKSQCHNTTFLHSLLNSR